jgi:hypothetical protein
MKPGPSGRAYAPVRACIYCGATAGPFSDEHIIPLSLGGNLVLPESSCHPCAKITGRFEMDVARFNFAGFRSRLSFPTRRPKDQLREEPLTLIGHDNKLMRKKLA